MGEQESQGSTEGAPGEVSVYPVVRLRDVEAGIGWLERTLGFERFEVVRGEDGGIVHAEVRLGHALVMLSSAVGAREPFGSMPPGAATIYLAITDPDALHARAVAAGADIPLGLTDTDYGSRDFTARDPEGNLWSFGTYRPRVAG